MRSGMANKLLVIALSVCAATAASAGQVIYVDAAAVGANNGSSWTDAYAHLQDALAAASAAPKPVEIRVAQGTYKPDQGAGVTPADREATFQLLNGVALRGGCAGSTGAEPNARDIVLYASILSGRLTGDADGAPGGPTYSLYVVTGSDTDDTAVLDGFAITNEGGNGMLIEAGSPLVTNCTFENNAGYGFEARSDSRLEISGCSFINNQDAGLWVFRCDVVLASCLFERNGIDEGRHAALHCEAGNLAAADCTFRANEAGAVDGSGTFDLSRCAFADNAVRSGRSVVYCWGDLTVRKCSFRANTAREAVILGAAGALALVDCEFTGNSSPGGATVSARDEILTASRCSFTNNWAQIAGAVVSSTTVTRLSDCTFTGNGCNGTAGAVFAGGFITWVSNCTFAGNRGQPNTLQFWPSSRYRLLVPGPVAELTQCIVWDGPPVFGVLPPRIQNIVVTYSDVQGGRAGRGNIEVDPCFVRAGYWADPNDPSIEVGPDGPNAVWVAGDYHLKSQAGHWDRGTEMWIHDDVTSLCIDAGDPNGYLGSEPFPNGGFVNMGTYGGTLEASRSYFGDPVCENQLAGDINGDCKVDQADMDILLLHWLMDGVVPANLPPVITVISPEDGAEISAPTPLVFRADASDPDGTVVRVSYSVGYRWDASMLGVEMISVGPADNWKCNHSWSNVLNDGAYTVWAEAMDNEGAKTVSPQITITLHPAN